MKCLVQNDAQKGTKFEGSLLDPSPSQTISPLKRFRAQSFKNLSVSDLVAPAWCELKFWYSLTRHGDVEKTIKKTIQMKKGAQIHKKLERELFTPIKVETQSKVEAADAEAKRLKEVLDKAKATIAKADLDSKKKK